MKKLCLIAVAVLTYSLCGAYSNAEKRVFIEERLSFVDSQKIALNKINLKNKCIYKQAQEVANYIFQENYFSIKRQIKLAVEQILASQELINYHHYSVMLKAPLIGRDCIKAKNIPTVRPDNSLNKKINDILVATLPAELLENLAVLTYFEAYLNYKMDLIDSQFIVGKFNELEKEMRSLLVTLEN